MIHMLQCQNILISSILLLFFKKKSLINKGSPAVLKHYVFIRIEHIYCYPKPLLPSKLSVLLNVPLFNVLTL